MSGRPGGPALYAEKIGPPMLRARHRPFAIGTSERDQWMACMSRAMQDIGVEQRLQADRAHAFFQAASHLRNRQGEA